MIPGNLQYDMTWKDDGYKRNLKEKEKKDEEIQIIF